ncbi:arylsulfotransferase family protein [Actinokineospora sp.]|uniref:arylsulfotransferase family protein n=1 Tax=Actinokineospora sp. TaxID=1872133 RepID=UPI003D6BDAF1
MRCTGCAIVLVLLGGCLTEPGELAAPPAPVIDRADPSPGSGNALSAAVAVRLRYADSAIVRFGTVHGAALDSATPAVKVEGDSALIPVLGLLPGTAYALRVTVYGPGGVGRSELLHVTTDTLPSDLPRYAAGGADPSPGYLVFAAGGYGLAIDNTGRIVWYVRLPDPATLNFQPQPTGRYYTRPIAADQGNPAPWLEIDPLGRVTRTLGCARGLVPRFHDLIAVPDGSYWVMCDETRTIDLSAVGGVAGAQVTGTVIQHMSAAGGLLFEWRPFEHFEITDLDAAGRAGPSVNWTHGNALDLDADGNLVVSFRSLSELTTIDTRTGAVVWRMGGLRNQFVFGEAPPPFSRQHGVRLTAGGDLLLLDNLGHAAGSRGERYAVDPATRSARLLVSYVPSVPTVAALGGTTQDLPNGHTLVAFGNGGRVEEYDAAGRMVWQIEGNAGYVFRAQRIRSLYTPGVGD